LYLFAFNLNSFSDALSLSLFQQEVAMSSAVGPTLTMLYALLKARKCKQHVIIIKYGALHPSARMSKSGWLMIGVMHRGSKCPEHTECIGLRVTVENIFLELC